MGYQVGATCYTDKALAENVYFSQVSPIITESGVRKLDYYNNAWYYGSAQVKVNLPTCSPLENYQAGYEMVMQLLPTAVMLFLVKLIAGLLKAEND